MLWLLRKRLELCCATQQAMMEARLTREMERNRSVLANATVPIPGYTPAAAQQDATAYGKGTAAEKKSIRGNGVAPGEPESYAPDPSLTQEQVQMFEKGNQDMMTHYQMTLDKVRYISLPSARRSPSFLLPALPPHPLLNSAKHETNPKSNLKDG